MNRVCISPNSLGLQVYIYVNIWGTHFPQLTGCTGIFKHIYILYAFLPTDRVYRYIYICTYRFEHLYLYIYMSQLEIWLYLSVYIYLPAGCTGILICMYLCTKRRMRLLCPPNKAYNYICVYIHFAHMDLLIF